MKNLLSAIILFLACAVLVSGITLSYFSDKSDINTSHFTTGNVKVDVEVDAEDKGNWSPENAKTITWFFTNTGSLDATLEITIESNWDSGAVQQTVLNTVYKDYSTALIEPTVSRKLRSEGWEQELEKDVYHFTKPVKPNEEIPLEFKLLIDDITGYEGADYNITLSVTATQVIDE